MTENINNTLFLESIADEVEENESLVFDGEFKKKVGNVRVFENTACIEFEEPINLSLAGETGEERVDNMLKDSEPILQLDSVEWSII